MHDSAVAIVAAGARAAARATCSSTRRAVVAEERVGVALGGRRPRSARRPGRRGGSQRVTTSTSPRRRQVVISSASRSTPSRSRDPQRLGDLGLRDAEQAQHPLAVGRRAGDRRPEGRVGLGGGATSAAARAAARAARRRPGRRGPRRRHDEAGRGADGLEHRRALRDEGLLARRPRAARRGRGRGQRSRSGSTIRAIRSSSASSRRSGAPWTSATTSAVRSSAVGPEAAAGDDHVHPLGGQPAQRRGACPRAGRRRRRCRRGRRRARAAARRATARCGRGRGP